MEIAETRYPARLPDMAVPGCAGGRRRRRPGRAVTRSPPRGVTGTTGRAMYRDREVFATDGLDRGASRSRTEDQLDEQLARNPLVDVRW